MLKFHEAQSNSSVLARHCLLQMMNADKSSVILILTHTYIYIYGSALFAYGPFLGFQVKMD